MTDKEAKELNMFLNDEPVEGWTTEMMLRMDLGITEKSKVYDWLVVAINFGKGLREVEVENG